MSIVRNGSPVFYHAVDVHFLNLLHLSLLLLIQITIAVASLHVSTTSPPLGCGFGDIDIRPLSSFTCASIAYTPVGPRYKASQGDAQ